MLQETIYDYKSLFDAQVHSELRAQHNAVRRVTLLAGQLVNNVRQDFSGVSARVLRHGVYGFSSMADSSPEAIKSVLQAADANAAFMDRKLAKGKAGIPSLRGGRRPLAETWHDSEQKRYIEALKTLDDYIVRTCPELLSRTLYAYSDTVEKVLAVSDGHDAHTLTPRSYIYVFLSAAAEGGSPVEIFKPLGGYGDFLANFSDVAWVYPFVDKLYAQLQDKRKGVYARAGLQTVVMSGELAGILAHEAVGHTVEADLVLGGSVAGQLLNQPVASELVSLVDFAHTVNGQPAPLPVFVDDEGTPAEDAVLIKDGVLTGYMHSRESARHFDMQPQGNARAWLFSDEPLIRMRNTAILPGKQRFEELIASVEDGYYLCATGNGQADTTGEFMFGVTMGYEIKNGRLGRALLDTTISGVAFEMLKTVDMVSDELEWASSGFCGKKQPIPVGVGGPALRCKVTMGGR